jgi:hypothetical protein
LRYWMAGLFGLAMIPFLATPVLPLIDFYNHLARFFVLSHIGSSAFLQTHYQAHWGLLPNIGVDVLATPLLYVLPPMLAGHVIVIAILAVQYGGVLYFRRALTGQGSLLAAVLLLPLLYSYILNWGFANFLLGLGLVFWAAGWWLRVRDRPVLAVPVSCVLALLIFFCHGMAFILYGMLLGLLEVGIFLRRPDASDGESDAPRRIADLVRALAFVAVQAILPVAYFLLWRNGVTGGGTVEALPMAKESFAQFLVRETYNHLEAILRVEEGPALWFDIATLFAQIGLIAFLVARGRLILVRLAWLAIGAVVVLALIPLPTLFGIAFIDDRLPLFAALVLIGSLGVGAGAWVGAERIAGAALIGIVFVRLAAIAVGWHGQGALYREYDSIAAQIPREKMTITVLVGASNHETKVPRPELYGPLLVIQAGQAAPLFSDAKQQPLLLNGPLKRAMADLKSRPEGQYHIHPDQNRYMTAAAASGFEYLLVCNADLLTQPFPPQLQLVARTAHFALLRAPGPTR